MLPGLYDFLLDQPVVVFFLVLGFGYLIGNIRLYGISPGPVGAALSVVTDAAKSNVPALGCTGAYAFANVIRTVAGTLIMLI